MIIFALVELFITFSAGCATFSLGFLEEYSTQFLLGGRLVCGLTFYTIESILQSVLSLWCEDILGPILSLFEIARCLGGINKFPALLFDITGWVVSGIFVPVILCPNVLEISKLVYFSTPLCFLPLAILLCLCFFDSRVWSHVPRVPGREDVYRVKCDSTLSS